MSELKAVHAFDVYEAYTKTGDDDAAQVYLKSEADKVIAEKDKAIAELKGDIADLRDDKKSTDAILDERNAEIAELKRQIEFLKTTHDSCGNCNRCADGMGKVFDENLDKLKADYKEACDRLQTANLIKDEQLAAARHHKYKRCLAMARIAQDDWHLHNSFYAMGHREFEKRKCEFYEKWCARWLKIAEQFKEEK